MSGGPAAEKSGSDAFLAGGIVYRRAGLADDTELKRTLKSNAMESWVKLSLEREPDFFRGESLMGSSVVVIAQEGKPPHATVGMYTCRQMPVFCNGKTEILGYLGGLRVNPAYRYKIRILKEGYASIRSLVPEHGESGFWFTSISSENLPAKRLLEAGLRGMPRYRPVGEMETIALTCAQGKPTSMLVAACNEDIAALAAFYNRHASQYQFSPHLQPQWLRDLKKNDHDLALEDFWLYKDAHGNIKACMAIWDQRGFKQAVIRGYRFPLGTLRLLYNLFAAVSGRLKLPANGEMLQQVFISFVAFDPMDHATLKKLLKGILYRAREKKAQIAVFGFACANPLLAVIKHWFRYQSYKSCIETVHWPDQPEPVLDDRQVQADVALL